MQFKDQLNSIFELEKTPKRIICLVPSITELLVDLGLRDVIVGITKFCIHPSGLRKEKSIIGGTKNIKIDKIKQLNPDFIICNKEENTQEIVATCKSITTTFVSDIYTIDDTIDLILQFGEIFSCEALSIEIANTIRKKRKSFLEFIQKKSTKTVAYFIWKAPWMVAANDTFINHLLGLNNFKNVFDSQQRYPEINLNTLKELESLECILLSSEPYPFTLEHVTYLKQKTPKTKVILVDGEYFSWYGSRLIKAFDYFKELHAKL